MKSKLRTFIIFILSFLCFIFNYSYAQVDDLGVVWSKTYGQGNIINIKSNADGTYTACGHTWVEGITTDKYERLVGLVIEFDESGNELRRATATLPQYYFDSHTGNAIANDATARFNVAFKTSDGGFLAFGTLYNKGAPIGEKQYDWAIRNYANSPYLLKGLWIVKFDANLQIVKDTLVRGRFMVDGWTVNGTNTFLVGGFDAQRGDNQNSSNISNDITLLRRYDENGSIIGDMRRNDREISALYKYPDGTFVSSTPDKILRINAAGTSVSATAVTTSMLPGTSTLYILSVTSVSDGGVFITSHLNSNSNIVTHYNSGTGLYKLNSSYQHVYRKLNKPSDTIFFSPLLLPGSTSKYIGTASVQRISGSTVSVIDNKIYELTDNGSSYTYRVGNSYPNGTALKAVSQTDGFFSCGSGSNGQAAIVKLSTCANFKLDVGSTNVNLFTRHDTVTFQGHAINYSGNKGTVEYTWTLTDITSGGAATNISTSITGTENTAIPPITFTLQPGKNVALLRYVVSAIDSFETSGVKQSCQQTQIILIKISRVPDNVSNAECTIIPVGVEWGMTGTSSNESNLSPYQSVVVGDIDGDGIVEIIAAANPVELNPINTDQRHTSSIAIYKGNDITAPPTVFNTTSTYSWDSRTKYGIVKTKISDKDSVLIVVAEFDTLIRAYNNQGNMVWASTVKYSSRYNNGLALSFGDLNHDGIPEIAIGGKIFSSVDGSFICEISSIYTLSRKSHVVQLLDVFNDGTTKYVMGNHIFDVCIDSLTHVIDSLRLNRKITPPSACPDGGTSLFVDMDKDGQLEMIVANNHSTSYVTLYIADPFTDTLKAFVDISSAVNAGYPFVGDVDGDGYNEITLIVGDGSVSGDSIRCYKYDKEAGTLEQFWSLGHTDKSYVTGLTLFDFDQDGKSELVYRDEENLRIIDGREASATNPPVPSNRNKAITPNYSGTSGEYPVVADVDGDGQAEIIIVGGNTSSESKQGRLWIYKSSNPATSPWAPARKVWNQYAYHPLNVNEDLTLPAYPLNPAIFFTGADDTVGTADDVQPYNNYLQQQTMLNMKGLPFWLAPNAEFDSLPVFDYYDDGDSLVITVTVKNAGDASLQAPLYVSAFMDENIEINKITTDSCMTNINPGETQTVRVIIRNLSNLSFDKIIISLNDKSGNAYVQTECDYDNNLETFSFHIFDHHLTTSCEDMPVSIDVLSSAIIPSSCTPEIKIVSHPAHVTANIVSNEIKYSSTQSGTDTVIYRVICETDTTEAKIYVTVNATTAFVDDVWYYGMNSQGIRFVNNGSEYVAQDASGESKVNSHENSLVVSSPYCDGQNIFYSSHNQLYNSFHAPMTNGHFMGHQSVADGLAACYMGANKYLFFSVTNAYESGNRGLKAYTVDMTKDHGKGAITDSAWIEQENADMSESIELLAANEAHKYWLIYAYKIAGSHHELRVHSVDVTGGVFVTGGVLHTATLSTTLAHHTYTLKASPQNNRIAIANSDDETVDVFDFDNATGVLDNLRTTPATYKIDGLAYGLAFSPDGNQLYAAGYTIAGHLTPKLYQYKITPTEIIHVDNTVYWTYHGNDGTPRGGGLKSGPDGKIYVVLSYDAHVGVVDSPNEDATALSARYSTISLHYTPASYALQFSTGITKPAIIECNNLNTPPSTQADSSSFCLSSTPRSDTVNVLINDTDTDLNDTVYLTSADFAKSSDKDLATLTVVDSSIILSVNSSAAIDTAYVFEIIYNVKDKGLPASQCATGILKIEAIPLPVLTSTLTPTSICSGTKFEYTAKTNILGTVFSWRRPAVTGISESASTGNGVIIDETLTNTTTDSIEVTYLIDMTTKRCIHTDTVKVKVYASLKAGGISPSPTQSTYCYGGAVSAIYMGGNSSTGGFGKYEYKWESSLNGTSWTPVNVSAQSYSLNSPLTQTTYYRREVTDEVCGTIYSDTVTIYPIPVIPNFLTEICPGFTVHVPSENGRWESSDSNKVDIVGNGKIVGMEPGYADITFYDTIIGGCSASVRVTVNPYPEVQEIEGKQVVCEGQEIELTNTTPNGVWTKNNDNISFDNPQANPVKVTGVTKGKSFVTYTVFEGICQTKRTFRVKVIPNLPPPKIIIGIER
jgi:hypothetical protein